MKASALFIFLGLSVLVHIVIGGGLYFYGAHQSAQTNSDVLDLTVMPYSSGVSGVAPSAVKATRKAAVPAAPADNPAASSSIVPVNSEAPVANGAADAGPENSGASHSAGGLGEWTELTQKPKVTREVKAKYTEEARQKGLEGSVVCDLVIGDNGRIRSVVLVQGLGSGLDEAALEALKSFEFSPAKIGDKTVAVKIRYKYRFQLQHQ